MKFICAANWKMNKNARETHEFFRAFLPRLNVDQQANFVFFPPALNLAVAAEHLEGTQVGWGAQNVYPSAAGAFTGENSPAVLADMGATHALVGHSERRTLFKESDEFIAQKVKALQDCDLTPVLCVGETLEERKGGKTESVVQTQLKTGLSLAQKNRPILIAYEPVWAIGTGQVATPAQAEEVHRFLRERLTEWGGPDVAKAIPILYGGSVKPENSAELSRQPNINGFLIGGASLQADSLLQILAASAKK